MRNHTLHAINVPQVILKYENYKFYWDCTLLTNKIIHSNQPDILLGDKTNKEAALINKGIPLTYNLQDTITEKQRKYQELAFEIRQQLQRNKIAIHLVFLAMGVIPNKLTFASLTSIYHHAYCDTSRKESY